MTERAYHDIVKVVPRQIGLGNQAGSNERANGATNTIERVEKTQGLVCPIQVANPSIPGSITDTIAKASDGVGQDQHWVRGVEANDDVGNDVAYSTSNTYTPLANLSMQHVVYGGCKDIPDKRGQENEGDDNVAEIIVFFQLQRLVRVKR